MDIVKKETRSISQNSTDSKSSDEQNILPIEFQKKQLRKIAPNIYEVKDQNKVIKISQHICLDFCQFNDSSDEDSGDEYGFDSNDEDSYIHTQKCTHLEREFDIMRKMGSEQTNLIHYNKFHKNILVNGAPCCALEMPLYSGDFFEKFIQPSIQSPSTDLNLTEIKKCMRAILEQICRMHEKCICHNDIKPENILYSENENQAILIDLEYANYTDKINNEEMRQLWEFRDLTYCAPEIFMLLKQYQNQTKQVLNNQNESETEESDEEVLYKQEDLKNQVQSQLSENQNSLQQENQQSQQNIEQDVQIEDQSQFLQNQLPDKISQFQLNEECEQQKLPLDINKLSVNDIDQDNILNQSLQSQLQYLDSVELVRQSSESTTKLQQQENISFNLQKNDVFMFSVSFFALLFKSIPRNYQTFENFNEKDPKFQCFKEQDPISLENLMKKMSMDIVELVQNSESPCDSVSNMVDFFLKGMNFFQEQRYSALQLLNHPWFQMEDEQQQPLL